MLTDLGSVLSGLIAFAIILMGARYFIWITAAVMLTVGALLIV